jgi:predicted lysophospholipase L1 biosynthesis ABC-type transport system permease subunit
MSVSTLNNIRLQIGHVGISTLLLVGNVANFLTVVILGRTLKQRINSCALYLFCAAIANWFVIDTVLISSLYGLDHMEPINTSNVLCKLRWYGGHVLFAASRSFSKLY